MFKYSPVDVKDKIINLFPELSFFQPYINGVFDNDPKRGRITVGVRTPWYDIVYLEIKSGSFWENYVSETGLNAIIDEVRGDLDAAVSIQTEFGQGEAMRLDKSDLAEYLKDPDTYINNRRENKLSKPKYTPPRIYPTVYSNGKMRRENDDTLYVDHDNSTGISDEALIEAKDITFLCTCQSCKKKFYEIRDIRIKNQRERINGSPTVYVNHDNVWTDRTLVEAARVIFLCKCTKCQQYSDHIRELRREK